MRILICDDQIFYADRIEELCRRYSEETGRDFEILAIDDFEKRGDFDADLIYLDIDMPGKTGIEIKSELEKSFSRSLVVFVTNFAESVYDAFGVNVIGFIPKPLEYESLKIVMEKAENLLSVRQSVEIEPGVHVSVEDIIYIKMDNVYSDVYLTAKAGKTHRIVRKTMMEWNKILPDDCFVQISRGCIAGCMHISGFFPDYVLMDTGEKHSVSRRRKSECLKKYYMFAQKMSRFSL